MINHQRTPELPTPAALDLVTEVRTITIDEEDQSSITNRSARFTYLKKKSVSTSGATPGGPRSGRSVGCRRNCRPEAPVARASPLGTGGNEPGAPPDRATPGTVRSADRIPAYARDRRSSDASFRRCPAARFSTRRAKMTIRVCGLPKRPRLHAPGRNPGNAYASAR